MVHTHWPRFVSKWRIRHASSKDMYASSVWVPGSRCNGPIGYVLLVRGGIALCVFWWCKAHASVFWDDCAWPSTARPPSGRSCPVLCWIGLGLRLVAFSCRSSTGFMSTYFNQPMPISCCQSSRVYAAVPVVLGITHSWSEEKVYDLRTRGWGRNRILLIGSRRDLDCLQSSHGLVPSPFLSVNQIFHGCINGGSWFFIAYIVIDTLKE